jgi:TPR repeat protein
MDFNRLLSSSASTGTTAPVVLPSSRENLSKKEENPTDLCEFIIAANLQSDRAKGEIESRLERYIEKYSIEKKINWDQIFEVCTQNEGDYSQLFLGMYHYYYKKNTKQSIDFFLKSSEMNNRIAPIFLGVILWKEREKYFELSFKRNSAIGAYYMGKLCFPLERQKSLDYFSIGMQLGSVHSIAWIGKIIDLSTPQPPRVAFSSRLFFPPRKVDPEAIKCYNIALSKGSSVAANFLADHCYEVEGNTEKAIRFHQRAIELGSVKSINQLGLLYHDGGSRNDVNINYIEAFRLFSLAAEANYKPALSNLASMYERGKFVPQDLDKAVDLYIRSVFSPDDLSWETPISHFESIEKIFPKLSLETQGNVIKRLLVLKRKDVLLKVTKFSPIAVDSIFAEDAYRQQVESLSLENARMRTHIDASPYGSLFLAALKDWDTWVKSDSSLTNKIQSKLRHKKISTPKKISLKKKKILRTKDITLEITYH